MLPRLMRGPSDCGAAAGPAGSRKLRRDRGCRCRYLRRCWGGGLAFRLGDRQRLGEGRGDGAGRSVMARYIVGAHTRGVTRLGRAGHAVGSPSGGGRPGRAVAGLGPRSSRPSPHHHPATTRTGSTTAPPSRSVAARSCGRSTTTTPPSPTTRPTRQTRPSPRASSPSCSRMSTDQADQPKCLPQETARRSTGPSSARYASPRRRPSVHQGAVKADASRFGMWGELWVEAAELKRFQRIFS